jgi:very-short-patch-repair endonuclease
MNLSSSKTSNEKALRLVEYLLRLASLRTKWIRDIAEYQKVLWISDVPHDRYCFTGAWGRDEEHDPDVWLEVQNRREPQLPAVPPQCKDWVCLPSLRNKNELPKLRPEITRERQNPLWQEDSDEPKTIPYTEYLKDHPKIQGAWSRYVEDKWLPWVEEHNAWEKVHKVYSVLFAIHQEQVRRSEEYDLVLGLGLLTWQTPNGQRVRRHLVVADAILEFEASLGKFTVRSHPEGAKLRLELDMLDIEEQPSGAEERAKASLADAQDDPWEKSIVEGILKALVHSISSQGEYDGSLEAKNVHASAKPIVQYAPALILRKRSVKGLIETLKRLKEQVAQIEDIPAAFADLAEIQSNNEREPSDLSAEANVGCDGEIFFPKPWNEAQRRIVDKLRGASCVLVQGPPGTGKSHTIANLICHLLATGRRTLVTAKTPRALQVLEGLLPEELRPLCINLLGTGLEEQRSLESSVDRILRKREDWNEEHAARERAALEKKLRRLREEKAKVERRQRDIRESETHTYTIADGAYRGTAARIAEAVNRDRVKYKWFTDTVTLEKPCSISVDDLQSVLIALREFTPERRRELSLAWPDTVHSPEEFANLVRNEASATEEEQNALHGADERLSALLARTDLKTIESIRTTFSFFLERLRRLRAIPHSWINNALRDVLGGDSSLWRKLLRVSREVIASIGELVPIADQTRIELPDNTDIRSLYEDVCKLKEHMETGGGLGWGMFRPKPVKERLYVIETVRIGGRPCRTVEHFATLAKVLHVRIECEKAWSFWQRLSKRVEGPYALQVTALKALCDVLENVLALENIVAKCREVLRQCPDMDEPQWAHESQIERIVASCRLTSARIRKQIATQEIQDIEAQLSYIAKKGGAHPVTHELLTAIRSRDVEKFALCVNKIRDLEKQRLRFQTMEASLSKLRLVLPQLTKSLEQTYNESYWDEHIQSFGDAWRWAQARYWVEKYIRNEDLPALGKRAKQIEDEMKNVIAKLAALHAWSFCFSRLKEDHRRHMEAWQQSMRRLGRGTGRHASHHRRDAQEHLNKCREAVPAWVMPLHRVWDTVTPSPGMFDVVIVDEASQCGVEALPLFYLGKKILIVGDDKQISPDAVGLPRDAVHQLMGELLYDFHFKSSFDVESSLFDHAKLRHGTAHITLREHFRCMPEIIRFSNDLCYSATPLIPLRQYGTNRLPPLEHIFVSGGYREGDRNRVINRPEAEAVVKKIVELCRDRRYKDKTMGVVVLQGEAQAGLIEGLLLEQLGAEEMNRRRLVCGNPYSFQGDERDVILLSMVAAGNERIGPLTKTADERRFNVAASRARDQMILFHSVTCEELSEHDLRRRLLEFFERTRPLEIAGIDRNELERRASQDNRSIVNPPAPFESWFEVDVALEILRRDFTVLSQYEVAGKRIDLVIEGGQARLAVECDGDNWHGADRYEADMQRQRQLERCGWEFYRVRASAFYANKEDALAGLWQALEERGIFPASRQRNTFSQDTPSEDDVEDDDLREVYGDPADEEENDYEEEESLFDDPDNYFNPVGRRVNEISNEEIQTAIRSVLAKCPNHSCTLHSITARVLKEIGVRTRGNPRKVFQRQVMRCLNALEGQGIIKKYKAKNNRIRLLKY